MAALAPIGLNFPYKKESEWSIIPLLTLLINNERYSGKECDRVLLMAN